MLQAEKLMLIYPKPGRNDCFALLLAKQEACPLLSGDAALRRAAESEKIHCMGTIWIIEEMLKHDLVSYERAKRAYQLTVIPTKISHHKDFPDSYSYT
jgi:predicted nucleic acid-binding protein